MKQVNNVRKKLLLRIGQELWEDINCWAQDELRSVNGQIAYLLRHAVQRRQGAAPELVEPTDPEPVTNNAEQLN